MHKTILATLLLASATVMAQPPSFPDSLQRIASISATRETVHRMFGDYAQKNHFPGFTYGIIVDGQLLYSGAFGLTDIQKNIPASIKSDFRIASMTKSFTTLAIMKLRDEGRINIEAPASRYIPEMNGIKMLTSDAPVI